MNDNPLIDGLRQAGAKMTAQRLAICGWLHGNDSHPTVSAVYEALLPQYPTMSLATVYNTLSLLVQLDLIHEVGSDASGRTRYDPRSEPHVNLVCTRCQRITDVLDADLTAIEALAPRYGFAVNDVNISVHGLCASCQETGEQTG